MSSREFRFVSGMNHLLFVYGTLKRGQPRADCLDGQKVIAEVKTTPDYRLFRCGSFPALVEASRSDVGLHGVSVTGELWEVDDDCIQMLDRVEGVGARLFERRLISLIDGREVQAYLFKGSVKGFVDCGSSWY